MQWRCGGVHGIEEIVCGFVFGGLWEIFEGCSFVSCDSVIGEDGEGVLFVLIILHSLYLEYDREGFSLGLRSFLPEISIVNSRSSLPPSASSSGSHDHKLTSE